MEPTDSLYKSKREKALVNNNNYYKYIFKKTERIVCAVFYILRSNKDNQKDTLTNDLEKVAEDVLDKAIETLKVIPGERSWGLEEFGFALIGLESKLRVMNAAGLISSDHMHVFAGEIDTVLRTLRNYNNTEDMSTLFAETRTERAPQAAPRKPSLDWSGESREAVEPQRESKTVEKSRSRRERIMDVLKEKGQASIKDVSDMVTDCSEKTIQRELNAMIKEQKVVREGERRWSKYSIA